LIYIQTDTAERWFLSVYIPTPTRLPTQDLQTIPFFVDQIIGGAVDGEVFVPRRRLCENLGVDYPRNLTVL
jgi:hypothetical protein